MPLFEGELLPPGSDKWLEHPPDYVLQHHPGQLRGKLLLYVAQVFGAAELRAQADCFRDTPLVGNNDMSKAVTRAFENLLITRGLDSRPYRVAFSELRARNKAFRQGKRGDDLKAATKALTSHNILETSGLPDHPTMAELKALKHPERYDDYWVKMAEVIETYTDMEGLTRDWGFKKLRSTLNERNRVLFKAEAIREGADKPHQDLPFPRVEVDDAGEDRIRTVLYEVRKKYPPKLKGDKPITKKGDTGSGEDEIAVEQDMIAGPLQGHKEDPTVHSTDDTEEAASPSRSLTKSIPKSARSVPTVYSSRKIFTQKLARLEQDSSTPVLTSSESFKTFFRNGHGGHGEHFEIAYDEATFAKLSDCCDTTFNFILQCVEPGKKLDRLIAAVMRD